MFVEREKSHLYKYFRGKKTNKQTDLQLTCHKVHISPNNLFVHLAIFHIHSVLFKKMTSMAVGTGRMITNGP